MKTANYIVRVLFILFTGIITAEARQYHFTHLSIDDGLSHNDITGIIQDSNGFMWFATRDGLNRFDGKKIKVYKHPAGSDVPLGVNFINAVEMDSDGKVWIGSKGVSYYNAMTDSLEFFNKGTIDGYFPQNIILSIRTNSKGWTYFLEEGSGVYCYQPETEQLLFFPFDLKGDQDTAGFSATVMWIAPDDRIWLAGDQGRLLLLNPVSGLYHSIKIDCLEFLNDRAQTVTGNGSFIYIGFQYSGVIRYDPEKNLFTNVAVNAGKQATYVHDILIDGYSLWVATEQGLYIYDELQGGVTHLQRDYFDAFSLSDDAIYSIFKDKDEGIWLGTYFGGVNYLSLEQSRFIEKYYPLVNRSSISGKAVREIVAGRNGELWIGTEDSGLNRFDPKDKSFRTYSTGQGLTYHNVHGLALVENHLLIGLYTAGLNLMDLSTGVISSYYVADDRHNVQNSIYSICYDSQRRILIGTRSGLYEFGWMDKSFRKFEQLDNLFIHQVYEDRKGNIWLATINNGLVAYMANGDVVEYKEFFSSELGVVVEKVLSIYEDTGGTLWLGTSECGLISFNPVSREIRHYGLANGIPDNLVYRVVEDFDGNIWFGTNKGLVRMNPQNGKVRIFTKNDGLLSNQFNYSSAYCDTNGKLYFGTIEGMVVINPYEIKEDPEYPEIFFTGFQIYNKEVPIGGKSVLQSAVTFQDQLELSYDQNTINFDFAVIRYFASQRNECLVKLDGFEKEWLLVDHDLRVSYSNLKPGNYTLRLQSSNGWGEWKEMRSMYIHISPPWWRSTMAYIVYLILAIVGVMVVLYYVKRSMYRKQLNMIRKIERDKERESYHAKIEFFTNIAHEIKTPLTLIKAPLEHIRKNKEFDTETTETLDTVMKNTDRLLSLTYQLLDFRRVEDKRLVLKYESTDVSLLLQLIYDRFKVVAGQKNIRFTLSILSAPLLVEVDVENFTKIISNLFNNALKYCEHYIKVSLHDNGNGNFEVVVENDGPVIPARMKDKIFEAFVQLESDGRLNPGRGLGLPLARSLAQLHNGQLVVDAACVKYNKFILTLPIRQARKRSSEETESPSLSGGNLRKTLLVVEDNLEMLDFVSRKLMKEYYILRATDGRQALKIMSESDIDMVISDIMMPGMDGFELLKTIKSQVEYSHIPVILLTARTHLQSKIDGLELGADAYVEKPFSLEFLIAQIQNILKNRAAVKEMFHKRPLVEANMVALTRADELFLQRINELIETNICNMQFGVDMLAEKMYISRSSLHRKIKGLSDLTPNDYIRLHRLKKAALLLQEGELRVNEIATVTGFASPSYFTKSFQQYFGMTPKEFARSVKL